MEEIKNNKMKAVITEGHGGYEKIKIKEIPLPFPQKDEVLIKVLGAGINNTDINTRLGWYSSDVKSGTEDLVKTKSENNSTISGGWGKTASFPLIQGTDCVGIVVKEGSKTETDLIGKRVLIRPCMLSKSQNDYTPWFGSDCNGSFAEYAIVPVGEVFPVNSGWSDTELASIPCAYGTAENLIEKVNLQKGERILITGASGGVGSAAVQLAKLRGAEVFGISGAQKAFFVRDLGAEVIPREINPVEILGKEAVDIVIDLVGGSGFDNLTDLLKRNGRYAVSGAIAGPIVRLDLRKLYLKDLIFFGSTHWEEAVFPRLINYIEENKIKPTVRETFPMANIIDAQKEFLQKKRFGKIVLTPFN